jgi:hypothetical protein
MATPDKELKPFLRDATRAYAAGEHETTSLTPQSFVAVWEDGKFKLVDSWVTDAPSPNARIYSGTEVVSCDDESIWRADYRGVMSALIEPEDIYSSYVKALRRPRPELPIRGPRSMLLGSGRVYRFGSVSGPPRVKDFVAEETIHQNGTRIYHGHILGGTLEKS